MGNGNAVSGVDLGALFDLYGSGADVWVCFLQHEEKADIVSRSGACAGQ